MIKICVDCGIEFEGRYNTLSCFDCRTLLARKKSDEYQKKYRRKNKQKIKELRSLYYIKEAHNSGYF